MKPQGQVSNLHPLRHDRPGQCVHDLKTLVLSRHPAIVEESAEEERVDVLVRAVAADLRLPLYNGLSRAA